MDVNEEVLGRGLDILEQVPERCRNCKDALDGACKVAQLAIDHFLDFDLVSRKFEVVLSAHCNPEITQCGYQSDSTRDVSEAMLVDVIWQLD